jgi:hypothetical protein
VVMNKSKKKKNKEKFIQTTKEQGREQNRMVIVHSNR